MRTLLATLVAALTLPASAPHAAASPPPPLAIAQAACLAHAQPPRPTTNAVEASGFYLCTEARTGLWLVVCADLLAQLPSTWSQIGCSETFVAGPAQRIDGFYRFCPAQRPVVVRSRVSGGNSRGELSQATSMPVAVACPNG